MSTRKHQPAPDFRLDFTPLRQFRRKADLTYGELGQKIGVAQQTIWRWERNKYPPDAMQLVALARALGTPWWSLFNIEEVR